jgi:hypothetical protein
MRMSGIVCADEVAASVKKNAVKISEAAAAELRRSP